MALFGVAQPSCYLSYNRLTEGKKAV